MKRERWLPPFFICVFHSLWQHQKYILNIKSSSFSSLRSKRFRAVSEQRRTEERDSRFWPREKWNKSHFSRGLCCAVFDSRNSTETLATQAIHFLKPRINKHDPDFLYRQNFLLVCPLKNKCDLAFIPSVLKPLQRWWVLWITSLAI